MDKDNILPPMVFDPVTQVFPRKKIPLHSENFYEWLQNTKPKYSTIRYTALFQLRMTAS
jgi:hypothetical protein